MKSTHLLVLSFFLLSFSFVHAQQNYFVDGYHGGVYGHYPVWKTRFIVDQMEANPEWEINLEIEPETWDSVRIKTPEDYRALQQLIQSPRVEIVNPAYGQPYMYNISGESIIRQLDYGMKKTWEHFPHAVFRTYSAEEPCFTSALPGILRGFGFEYASLKCPNTCWGGYMEGFGGETVNWIGPDGTSILTVPRYACEALEPNSTWQTTAWRNDESFRKACREAGIENPVGMCLQDAGWKGGPWIGKPGTTAGQTKYITWSNYFDALGYKQSKEDYRMTQNAVKVNLMWGSSVLQRLAQEVRQAENNIVMAEKIDAINVLAGKEGVLGGRFDEAWRTLMLAQHHDCWIVPYNKLNSGKTWAQTVTEWTGITNRIADSIIGTRLLYSTDRLPQIIVYNTTAMRRNELVEVALQPGLSMDETFQVIGENNKKQPLRLIQTKEGIKGIFRAEVAPYGYSLFHIEEGKAANHSTEGCRLQMDHNRVVMESDLYRMTIDLSRGGALESLIAKKENNREYVAEGGGFGELCGYFYEESRFISSTEQSAKASVVEQTSESVTVEVNGTIAGQPYTQTWRLMRDDPRIEGCLRIEWNKSTGIGEYAEMENYRANRRPFTNDRYKLRLLFPTNLSNTRLNKNAPFDVALSNDTDSYFNTWDSIKHNVILNWVDMMDETNNLGLALLCDHTTSYSHDTSNTLGLTIQYVGKGLWGRNYKIEQPTAIRFALIPHSNRWDKAGLWNESVRWNEPLRAVARDRQRSDKGRSFITLSKGVELSAVQHSGDAILFRVFNAEGGERPLTVGLNFPIEEVVEVDLRGKVVRSVALSKTNEGFTFSEPIAPFGIHTYRVKVK